MLKITINVCNVNELSQFQIGLKKKSTGDFYSVFLYTRDVLSYRISLIDLWTE